MPRIKSPNCLTYSVPEVAEIIGISRSKAYELVASGEIPAKKLGKRVVIYKASLPQWLERPNNIPTMK